MLKFFILSTISLLAFAHPVQIAMHSSSREKRPFPASYELFSSSFKQPDPPLIQAEFKCSYKQHAWSPTFSHVATGYLYHSPSQRKVRADATYASSIISSLFDYGDTTDEGLVRNMLYTLKPSVAATPQIWSGFVNPAWPLFEDDVLVSSKAVFGGVVEDRWAGEVASWKILYQGVTPVVVYLDSSNVLLGYDFYDTTSRTGIVNRYFDIELGLIDKRAFDFPKGD